MNIMNTIVVHWSRQQLIINGSVMLISGLWLKLLTMKFDKLGVDAFRIIDKTTQNILNQTVSFDTS
jgi:hypothetical protein